MQMNSCFPGPRRISERTRPPSPDQRMSPTHLYRAHTFPYSSLLPSVARMKAIKSLAIQSPGMLPCAGAACPCDWLFPLSLLRYLCPFRLPLSPISPSSKAVICPTAKSMRWRRHATVLAMAAAHPQGNFAPLAHAGAV